MKCKLVGKKTPATSSYLRSNFPLVQDTTRSHLSAGLLIARRSGPPFISSSLELPKKGAIIGQKCGANLWRAEEDGARIGAHINR